MPRLTTRPVASAADAVAAMEIWSQARRALDRSPTDHRRARVADRLAGSQVALLAMYGDRPAGVAAAEPYLVDDLPVAGRGHISMLAVTPSRWGNGIGTALVQALQAPPPGTGWTGLSVWTRTRSTRTRRLYVSRGFVDTGDRAHLREGEEILRLSWPAG